MSERLAYEYDFIAAWEARLRVEQIRAREPGRVSPRCTGGRRAGPPEGWAGSWDFFQRTQPYLVFDAIVRAADIIGQLLDADEDDDLAIIGVHRDELAALAPLLGLERFNRRACNKALAACTAPIEEITA